MAQIVYFQQLLQVDVVSVKREHDFSVKINRSPTDPLFSRNFGSFDCCQKYLDLRKIKMNKN
jgi:hypothetical protein